MNLHINNKLFSLLFLILIPFFITTHLYGQEKIYHLNPLKDILFLTTGTSVTLSGVYFLKNEYVLTEYDVLKLNKNNIHSINRWAAGYYSETAYTISDICVNSAILLPFTLLFNKNIRKDVPNIGLLYAESLLLTSGFYMTTAGTVSKPRPFLYGSNAAMADKTDHWADDSFYSGHTAYTSNATFFFAKVLTDYYPDMPYKSLVWACAGLLPAATAYYRIKAGRHFLTDVITGYIIGALTGYFVPHFHKKKYKLLP